MAECSNADPSGAAADPTFSGGSLPKSKDYDKWYGVGQQMEAAKEQGKSY